MSKDEYKNLIKKCMEEFNIPYITAKQFEHDNNINTFKHI